MCLLFIGCGSTNVNNTYVNNYNDAGTGNNTFITGGNQNNTEIITTTSTGGAGSTLTSISTTGGNTGTIYMTSQGTGGQSCVPEPNPCQNSQYKIPDSNGNLIATNNCIGDVKNSCGDTVHCTTYDCQSPSVYPTDSGSTPKCVWVIDIKNNKITAAYYNSSANICICGYKYLTDRSDPSNVTGIITNLNKKQNNISTDLNDIVDQQQMNPTSCKNNNN